MRCQRVARIGQSADRTRGLSRSAQFFRSAHAGVACILGPHLGDDAIDLVVRLGECLPRLPGELIGCTDGRSEHRGDRPGQPGNVFRCSYRGDAQSETRQKSRFKQCGSCRDGDNRRCGLVDPARFSPGRLRCFGPGRQLVVLACRPSSEGVGLAAVDQSETGLRHHRNYCRRHDRSGEIILIDGNRQRRRPMIDGPMIEGFGIEGSRPSGSRIRGSGSRRPRSTMSYRQDHDERTMIEEIIDCIQIKELQIR